MTGAGTDVPPSPSVLHWPAESLGVERALEATQKAESTEAAFHAGKENLKSKTNKEHLPTITFCLTFPSEKPVVA